MAKILQLEAKKYLSVVRIVIQLRGSSRQNVFNVSVLCVVMHLLNFGKLLIHVMVAIAGHKYKISDNIII